MAINGRQEKVYVPFAMLTGLMLDNDVFTNVSVTNGKIMNDGDRTIVAGLAFPGLQESLGLDRDTLDLPDYVEITANVERFELETTVTLAVNELFNDAASTMEDNDDLDGLGELDDKLDELTDAMDQLIDGSSRLYDGLCALLTSSEELVKGIDQLAAGAAQLKQGAEGLSAGAAQLQAGAAALHQGLDQLAEQNDALNGGAVQVFQSLLASANSQLAAAGVQAPELTMENYSQVLDGVIAAAGESPAAQQVAALKASLDSYNGFYQGLQNYTAGVAQAKDGAEELNVGVDALKNGADSLSVGAGQLYDGILTMKGSAPALIDGVTQLRDGAMELSDGLKEFNEKGVQKLVDAFDGDLSSLADRLEAVRESDAILREEFAKAGLDKKVWQYFTVVPDFKSVGVKNNARCFDYMVIIRAINTVDAMSASVERVDWDVLQRITDRILDEVGNVNRVCFDMSPKPPATIEFE